MLACLALVIVQLVNIQVVRAPALRASAFNPRNAGKQYDNQRGDITPPMAPFWRSPSDRPPAPTTMRGCIPRALCMRRLSAIRRHTTKPPASRTSTTTRHHPHAPGPDTLADTRVRPAPVVERQPDPDDRSDPSTGCPHCSQPDRRIEQGCSRLRREPENRSGPGRLLHTDVRPRCPGVAGCRGREARRLRRLQPEGL